MRNLGLISITLVWVAFWIYLGVGRFLDTPKQISKDNVFKEKEIKPSVEFIKKFKKDSSRLPTNREFYTWERYYYKDYSSDLSQKEDSLIPGLGILKYIRNKSEIVTNESYKFKKADWNKDFAIGVWRGSWEEYYFSWSDSYDTNNYSWSDGYVGLFVDILIGLIPLLFWFIYYKRKRKAI